MSLIVTVNKEIKNGEKKYLKLVEMKKYFGKENQDRLILEYKDNKTDIYISSEFSKKVEQIDCKSVEMTVYEGNLGLYYISRNEEIICAE
ncbi:hypothetical protein Fleli_3809 [Bernardetia litoralis DSM 6794]|uniref:Uncharacterized protein n=2 Tax=Bernardetia litoralis TaxID=999 RepID=I4AQ80_BERLS|nr:hypothetical protein Fleli_3809 [Bernardetia litoralis DSM 6794]